MATTTKSDRVSLPMGISCTWKITPAFPPPEVGLVIGEEARLFRGRICRAGTSRERRATFANRCVSAPWQGGGYSP